ncbi:MAG: hypothetical protein DWQ30_07890 [Acidobacteria bacterium]|nr:MAG: hypothetical protein DWQ30_07890 [Acidobacteriota bacterium]
MTEPMPGTETNASPFDRWGPSGIAALSILFATCLLNLGGFGLVSMEGMVVDGAASMLQSSNWAVPRVYGEIYTYKPALAYWLSAIPQALVEEPGELLLRLPFAGSAVAFGLVLFVCVGRRLGPRAGLYAVAATTGGALFLEKVRLAEFDVVLFSTCGLAILCACLALTRARPALGLWLVAYLAFAAAFLAKGAPAAMVFGPGLLVASVLVGRWRTLWSLPHLAGALVGVLAIAAYLASAIRSDGLAVLSQASDEAGWRALGWTWGELGRTLLKPLMIFAAAAPWSLVLLAVPRVLSGLPRQARELVLAAGGFLLGGVGAFIIVPTHEMRYYLPLLPALGVASGVVAAHLDRSWPKTRRALGLSAAMLATLGAAAGIYVGLDASVLTWPIALSLLVLAALAASPTRWLARLTRAAGEQQFATRMIVCSLVAAVAVSFVFWPRKAQKRDLSQVAAHFEPALPEDAALLVPPPADKAGKHASLYFYLDRPVATLLADPPSAGDFVIYVEGQEAQLGGLSLAVRREHEHPYYGYRLAEVLAVEMAGAARIVDLDSSSREIDSGAGRQTAAPRPGPRGAAGSGGGAAPGPAEDGDDESAS